MPVAKLKAVNNSDVTKAEEGNDSLDTIIRQAIGKEPFLSFSRAGESPVQWIQVLHALDQQELPGWPVLSPLKVQLQKCDKCSQEFCSPINYRRHIRAHHRLKKLDKDSTKNRELLKAYWNKLSSEEAKEVVSFKNVMLEDVPGSSIIKAMSNVIRKPGLPSLSQNYLRAGASLLDIVQGRSSKFPISSHELFNVLDDASEKTFLSGTVMSMQKYIFDGEAGKIGLETKNLVACTSFLVEQKLVKAWLADKDAEALRCQKLLVEEEEAAQKRQAELLERKRQKKLRQKEQKAKEQRQDEDAEIKESNGGEEETVLSSEESSSSATQNFESHIPDTFSDEMPLSLQRMQCPINKEGQDCESHPGLHCDSTDPSTDRNLVRQTEQQGHALRRVAAGRYLGPLNSQWTVANGFHASQNSQLPKLAGMQRHGAQRDQQAAQLVNGNKVWSRKSKPEIEGEISNARLQEQPMDQQDQMKNKELLIGSIPVTLGNCSQPEANQEGSLDDFLAECQPKQINFHEKPIRSDLFPNSTNRLTVKFWRPVSQHGTKGPTPIQNGSREDCMDAIAVKGDNQPFNSESCLRSSDINNNGSIERSATCVEDSLCPSSLRSSCNAAKAFLAQRWKDAVSSDHVKLIIYSSSEPQGCLEIQNCRSTTSQSFYFDASGYAETQLVNTEALESAAYGALTSKFRVKPGKVSI